MPLEKPAVVVGVSTVDSPITPSFIPFLKEKMVEDFCLGRKSLSPFSERKLAARLGEFLADIKGKRKEGPKSNS